MSVLDKTKDKIIAAKEDMSERAKTRAEEKADRAKAKAAEKAESERIEAERIAEEKRQAAVRKKEEMLADIEMQKAEAAEFGLSFSEYLLYQCYLSLGNFESRADQIVRDVKSIKTDATLANLNSSITAMNSQLNKLNK